MLLGLIVYLVNLQDLSIVDNAYLHAQLDITQLMEFAPHVILIVLLAQDQTVINVLHAFHKKLLEMDIV